MGTRSSPSQYVGLLGFLHLLLGIRFLAGGTADADKDKSNRNA